MAATWTPTPEQQEAYDAYIAAGVKLLEVMKPTEEEMECVMGELEFLIEEMRDCGWEDIDLYPLMASYVFENRGYDDGD